MKGKLTAAVITGSLAKKFQINVEAREYIYVVISYSISSGRLQLHIRLPVDISVMSRPAVSDEGRSKSGWKQ